MTPDLFARAALLLAPLPVAGHLLSRLRSRGPARVLAWSLVVVSVVGAERLTVRSPAPLRMLILIAALFLAMKAVVAVEDAGDGPLPPGRWLLFCLLWPGMQPSAFRVRRPPLPGVAALAGAGAARMAVGVGLAAASRYLPDALAPLLLLPGLSLVLHFGLFDVATAAFRRLGFDVSRPFRSPWRSRSLSEFWGRRWNLAFVEMLTLGVYRPLQRVAGRTTGAVAAFLLSGLFHELAISVPVGAGYGGPSLYFALHGGLVLLERRTGYRSRAATFAALLLPAPILFHPPFLHGVILPVIGR